METLCPSVESNSESVHDELTLGFGRLEGQL
jgi:hypothetical protein